MLIDNKKKMPSCQRRFLNRYKNNLLLKTQDMKTILILLTSFIFTSAFTQTQNDLNKQADESYKKADKELNEIYRKIITEYKSDTVFIKTLKTSQRIWITFRDSELNLRYPQREQGYYGSVHPMCVSKYLEQLTNERIKTLKLWLDGVEEGDVCSGSVKFK
jgi:uncharacterized protein YecT (DUF1311 family)